ncbi:hypothetical protein [Glaciimonas sp. PAMC28666]|nr:hypothetical protein [Glaciimonas sp. PAMC28666]QRX83742.1 hypothetical protein JQN73_05805 [Glaciimonas sp. PAMC28666]
MALRIAPTVRPYYQAGQARFIVLFVRHMPYFTVMLMFPLRRPNLPIED